MQQVIRIKSIVEEARKLRVECPELCRRAGVVTSTVYRWLDQAVEPRDSKYREVCDSLQTALDGIKADLRKTLDASAASTQAGAVP